MSFEEAEILRERAESFLRNAEELFLKGVYDLAAFNIEQYCQLIVKYKLLMKTGAYLRTRSLIKLLRLLSNISGGLDMLFEGRNIVMLTKIEDAYIGARYLARRYEKGEVEEMLKFVLEVFKNVIERI
ncbi:MAG: HEPN domain-containing protein [Candidatus Verstraetearchaeota archaeon]|nr:HEPN domain-containing protein [Candidatus Verstraetearchaeota archaeon]